MKLLSQLPFAGGSAAIRSCSRSWTASILPLRFIHTTPPKPATVVGNLTATGPPPTAPLPSAEFVDARVARRRKQADLLKMGQDLKAVTAGTGGGTARQKRFWKDVVVQHADEGLKIYLDKRPLRRPTKEILTIPHNKPHLASAIALEWDLLISAQQALKYHLIPMTSLVSRALDIADEDASGGGEIRANITKTVMRYLDTDSLLCWAPEPVPDPPGYDVHVSRTESLRSIQQRTAMPIIAFLTERVWPGVEIVPVLDTDSIIPRSQPQMTQDVIKGWISGLPAFELAGLERGVLAGKGLLSAVRLLVECSPELAHLKDGQAKDRFGVEEAAQAASLEVDWQTRMWGAVEDTHDVEREDVCISGGNHLFEFGFTFKMNRALSIRSSKKDGSSSSSSAPPRHGFSLSSLRGNLQPELSKKLYKLIKSENHLIQAYETAGKERLSIGSQLSEWGEATGDDAIGDISDKVGVLLAEIGEQEDLYAHNIDDSRAILKAIRNTEKSVQPSRDNKTKLADEIAKLRYKEPESAKLVILEQELVRAEAENLVAEAQLTNITRQKIKEAYAAEFAATIERAEKQILLARHGRRLLSLIDDTPVVPGDTRAPFEHGSQARQVMNDAEDDLKDWRLELDDLPSLDNAAIPSSASQHQNRAEGSIVGGEGVSTHQHSAEQHTERTVDGSRISSGTSVGTGPTGQSYASSEAPTTVPV